ncbi:MAG: type II toxin-antitoxin system VapC family toxin [Chloroflexi bacterium]|nr:type II toxin-antitoxin system VapC family toxin [Chloroflexota bacterium]
MIAVFDTNIVIDALNGVADADAEFERYERVIISRITWMEILVGEKENDQHLRDFLESHFEIAPIDVTISEIAVQLRRQHRVRLPDAIIWATAKAYDAVLITRNTKDFDANQDGIRIPYEI